MTHDPESLASAYLDGELTDDERRIAEADPAAMAEVDELRALRARLADVEPAGDAAREAAIGAAMAAFHRQHAATAAPSSNTSDAVDTVGAGRRSPEVVPLFRRFMNPAWLGAAAAAVVLVMAVGVIATRGADDEDSADFSSEAVVLDADDSADANAEEPAEAPADLPDADADRIAESELADDVMAADESDDGEMNLEMAGEPAEESAEATAEEPAEATADSPAADDGGEVFDTSGMLPPLDDPSLHFDDGDDDVVPMQSPLQVRAAAQYLLDERDAGRLGATPEYRCEFFNVLGAALYDDAAVGGDIQDPIDVLIDVDEQAGVVTAVDRDDCVIVAVITLDEP